jgi:hypothetical protein
MWKLWKKRQRRQIASVPPRNGTQSTLSSFRVDRCKYFEENVPLIAPLLITFQLHMLNHQAAMQKVLYFLRLERVGPMWPTLAFLLALRPAIVR